MARQVNRPAPKKNELAELLPLAGAVVGGVTAGPGGAMAGASQGAALGGLAGGVIQSQEGGQQGGGMAAAQRAMQPQQQTIGMPEVEDPESAIRQAQVALANLPQPVQQELGPALMMGQRAYQQRREAKA